MFVGDLEITVDRTAVAVLRSGAPVATGRWDGRRLSIIAGNLPNNARAAIETAIRECEEQAVALSEATSYDDQGVDITLIDWMLTLTPDERLRVLLRHASQLAPFVRDDLRE